MIRATRPDFVRLACLIALPLALAACGRNEPDTKAKAGGEILEGSISDAMLPLDTVRSQPPLAPQTMAAKPGGKADDEGQAVEETTDAAATATDGTATPAVPPTIAVPPAPTAPAP